MARKLADKVQKRLELILKGYTEEEARQRLAAFAKTSVQEMISTGEGSPSYIRTVNGRFGVREEQVELPGPIVYQFNWLTDIAKYCISFLQARWPVIGPGRNGHYRDSYFVLGSRGQITPDEAATEYTIWVTNDQPYSRKAQVGSKGFLVPKGMYEDCSAAAKRRFRGLARIEVSFIQLEGGYVLKDPRRKKEAMMTYPAIEISMGRYV